MSTDPSTATPVGVKVLVAVLCALLGVALVVQVRQTNSGSSLATDRPEDLVALLDSLQHREDDLSGEITQLQSTLAQLRRSGASSAAALAEAQRQLQALQILTGTVAAHGPGVRITIDDPAGTVPPELLLDAIEELRNAGAEVLQVGSVRIGVNSAFTGAAGSVVLDGTLLSQPYVILAIGDPPTLAAALAIAGGVTDTVHRAGATIAVAQSGSIAITALRALPQSQYARPAG